MFENPRRGRQARNFTANAPKILDLKSSSEQIFSRKLPLGAHVPSSVYKLFTTQNSSIRSIAHRGPVLWNILISKDKNFSNTSYKNPKRKTPSMAFLKS